MSHRASSAATILAVTATLACPVAFFEPRAWADDTAQGPLFLPTSENYYPEKARRLSTTGRVGLECSVDSKGSAHDIVILESGGPLLDDAAKKLLHDAHFRIPDDWSATGGPTKRFRYGVIFRLLGKPDVAPFDDNRRTVVVTGRSA